MTRDGWEAESAGLCAEASGELIAFDACVSAATGRMKRLPPEEAGLPGLWPAERSLLRMEKLKGALVSESWVTLHRSSFHIQMRDSVDHITLTCLTSPTPSLPPQDMVPRVKVSADAIILYTSDTADKKLEKHTFDASYRLSPGTGHSFA